MRSARLNTVGMTFVAVALAIAAPSAQTAQAIVQATGITEGLCVHVGCGEGSTTIGLDNDGRILVHALALSDGDLAATRAKIADAGKRGIVTAERVESLERLPYATNLVNLLIADLDALGARAPSDEEIERVVAPLCKAYVKKNGSWTVRETPLTPGMDTEFQSYNHDATGHPVSRDQLAGPATALQWIADYGWTKGEGVRVSSGGIYYVTRWDNASRNKFSYRSGRNAWNGISRWRHQTSVHSMMSTVAAGDLFYMAEQMGDKTGPGGCVVAIDGKTGRIIHRYEEAGLIDNEPTSMTIAWHDGYLMVTNRESLFVFDAASEALKWSFSEGEGTGVYWPTVNPANATVMVGVGAYKVPQDGFWGGRQPNAPMNSLICFDLATGAQRWRNDEIDAHPGTPGILGSNPPERDPDYIRKSLYPPVCYMGKLYINCQVPQKSLDGWEGFPKTSVVAAAAAQGEHEHGYVARLDAAAGIIDWGLDAHYYTT